MLRMFVWLAFLVVAASHVQADDSQVLSTSSNDATAAQNAQLQTCREGLLDSKSRPEARRRWAELLFSYRTNQAKTMIAELLAGADAPEIQRALCGVLADRARREPERLDPDLVAPLMDLLGVEAEDLRSLAAGVLADFPGSEVPERLGALAATEDAPLAKRIAAIDALAPNTHRREVVGQLIRLLDATSPEIIARVVTALESTTSQSFEADLDRWRRWWTQKSRLSEGTWLAEQLRVYRDRSRRLAIELAEHRAESKRQGLAVTARIASFQRELFRTVPTEQQDVKLKEWIRDPLPVVKRTALTIIRARIADEGKRPEGAVLAALLDVFRQEAPLLRREVLEIIQNLDDSRVIEAILAQLVVEDDRVTRHAIFKAFGKLARPEALVALVREIASLDSFPECVREAAIALGTIASKASGEQDFKSAAVVIKERYRVAPAEDLAMRAALLSAMAGMANGAFSPELLDAMESNDPEIIQPAIRGLVALGELSKRPRLRTLMAHSDPTVRLAATTAVGQIGREDADVERLLIRLDPTVETNEPTRDAAWSGFKHVMSSRSIADRIKAAQRLRELPDFEIKFLTELADSMPVTNGDAAQRAVVLDRLATALLAQRRYTEAVPHLRALCDLPTEADSPDARATALRLLDATLRTPVPRGTAELIGRLVSTAPSRQDRNELITQVATYLDSDESHADAERMRALLADLRSVSTDLLGATWAHVLERAEKRLEAGGKAQSAAAANPQGT